MVWVKMNNEFIRAVMKNVAEYLGGQGYLPQPEGVKMERPGRYYSTCDRLRGAVPRAGFAPDPEEGEYFIIVYNLGERADNSINIYANHDGFDVELSAGPKAGRKLRLTAKRAVPLGIGAATAAVKTKVGKKLDELTLELRADEITARARAVALKALKERFEGWEITQRFDQRGSRHYRVVRREAGKTFTDKGHEPAPAGTDYVCLEVRVDFDCPSDNCKVSEITVTEVSVKKEAGLTHQTMDDVLGEIKF